MKKAIIVVSILLCILASSLIYFFYLKPVAKNKPLMAVPPSASIIFEIENPFEQWTNLTENSIWNYLKSDSYFKEIGEDMDELTSDMKSNENIWELVMNRPMVMSIHKTRTEDYDFLYVIDLQRATSLNFAKNYIKDFSDDIEKVYTRDFQQQEIIEIQFKDTPTRYYLYLYENLLSISSTHALIEESIAQLKRPIIIRDFDFIDVSEALKSHDLNMYINYKELPKYLSIWIENDELNHDLFKMLKYSGLSLKANDQKLSASGYASIEKNQKNLLTALMKAGQGECRIGTIVPDNASYYISLTFEDTKSFYKEMEALLENEEEGASYLESKQKIENYLNISIEDNFLNWIEEEIVLIQLNSNSDKNKVELAIAIRHEDFEEAQNQLNYIEEQIRKKTPVKFKGIQYKNHEIQFLSIKGFFKLLLGKAFSAIDKPYYTVMEDYVVFSNSPRTLGKIITAVQEKRTLDHTKEYAVFMENFQYEANLFIYLSSNELLSDAIRILDDKSWKELKIHEDYFRSFPMIGLQLGAEGDLLRHQIQMNYLNHEQITNWHALVNESIQYTEITEEKDKTDDEDLISVENILPEDFNSKSFIEYFENGEVKFEVSLKDGKKQGRYFQFDSLGNMIIKGRYKNDEKSGIWRFYDENGELIRKERF
ncbi:DUF3352 domain-containing protein [Marivirga arenosa]|uniref:DUF3352 domain-containing protein n=1 Tax=Marivirga arenosa TaxID=3059076 RepID=A0AA49GFW3_9BACT|nr:DUF3352 domain-containing protein [Marivirga sp. BKB1-2]WKK80554.2 DUF3352 domain-containing protein [Marivirga sp. BKB1-2]